MSTGFLTDPKVERLIDRHGTDAVALSIALMSQAMRQEKAGNVELTFRTLGHESHTDKDRAKAFLRDAVDVGFVELVKGDEFEFEARFPAWKRHQQNWRQQKSREARKPNAEANVTPCHTDVTQVSPTDKTDKTNKQTKETADRSAEFQDWLTHFRQVTGRESITGSASARKAFNARRDEGFSVEDLKLATVGCQSDRWRVDNGHNVPDTILRVSNVEGYISQAKDRPGVAPKPVVSVEVSEAAEREWGRAREVVRRRLQDSAFRMYVEPLRVAGRSGDRLALVGPAPLVRWVDRRYRGPLEDALDGFDGVELIEEAA